MARANDQDRAREGVGEPSPSSFYDHDPAPQAIGLEAEFHRLADVWRADTFAMSSSSDIVLHPSYYQIIGMGREALPWILRELRDAGGHWFLALRAITRENPVSAEDRGEVKKMTDAWLRWGRKNGLLDTED